MVKRHCRGLPGAELTSLDRVLERTLWEIDQADVHAVTGGSDDGFLYSRGFIVAMGREFYGSVMDTPQMAVPWAECEELLLLCPCARAGRVPVSPGERSSAGFAC